MRRHIKIENRLFQGEFNEGKTLRQRTQSQGFGRSVAIDMYPAYISAVIENLPNASIVFDHFHIIKLFNDKLSDLRRKLFREAADFLKKNVLKGTRWLLIAGQENLDDEQYEGGPTKAVGLD